MTRGILDSTDVLLITGLLTGSEILPYVVGTFCIADPKAVEGKP
jgi:hypothetical protein